MANWRFLGPCIGTLFLVGTQSADAFGNDDHWVSGFGQGTCESVVTHGPENQIYVACDCGSLIVPSISFMLGGDGPKGDRILLTFDGTDPEEIWITDGEITSDCHACAANFDYVLGKFRKHSSVHVRFENGLSARFSLKGASKAIGDCEAAFYK